MREVTFFTLRRDGKLALSNCPTVEVRGQVLSEKRISVCTRHRFINMIVAIALRAAESDESSGEFYLRIRSSQADGLPYPAVSVKAARWVRLSFAQPLFISLGQVPGVKPRRSSGATGIGNWWPARKAGSAILSLLEDPGERKSWLAEGFPFGPTRTGSNREFPECPE